MTLIVHELKSELVQTIKPDANCLVESIRLHLYKHSNPSGTFKIQLRNERGVLIAESNSVSSTQIDAGPYFHGFIRFDIKAHLMAENTYEVALVPSEAYAFSESAYIGWCNEFDLPVYAPTYISTGPFSSPLSLEVWTKSYAGNIH